MSAPRIVEPFDVVKNIDPGFITARIASSIRALGRQRREDALDRSIRISMNAKSC